MIYIGGLIYHIKSKITADDERYLQHVSYSYDMGIFRFSMAMLILYNNICLEHISQFCNFKWFVDLSIPIDIYA